MGCTIDMEKDGKAYNDCVIGHVRRVYCFHANRIESKEECVHWVDDENQSPCLECREIMSPQPIETAPRDQKILLYWEQLDHYEDGVLYDNSGEMCHQVHDGSFDIQPSHWMPRPVLIKREEK